MKNIKKLNVIILLILLLFITGCEKSIELDPDISNCSHQWEIEKEYSIHDTKYLIGYKKCKKCGYIETPLNVDQSCCEIHQWKLLSSTDEKDVYSCEICKYEREEIKTTNIKYLKDKMNKSLFEDIFYVKFDNNEDSFQIENDEKTELKSIIDKMLECAINVGAEYLILGQHWLTNEHLGGQHASTETSRVEDLKRYVNLVISAIKSGVITYIAHPDMINFKGDIEIYKQEMRKICIASREYNVPLEINFLGIRDKRAYPKEIFWEIVGEEQPPVVFGFDAHTVQSAYDGESLRKAKEIVEKYKLNYIGKPDIIPLSMKTK